MTNGSSRTPVTSENANLLTSLEYQIKNSYQNSAASLPPDGRSNHASRYSAFHNVISTNNHQRDSSLPYVRQSTLERHSSINQSLSPSEKSSTSSAPLGVRGFSPFRNNQLGLSEAKQFLSNYQQNYGDCDSSDLTLKLHQKKADSEKRWQSPNGSPLPLRHQIPITQEQIYGNTSPIVLQRFYHQQKQQQKAQEAEEASKDDFGILFYNTYCIIYVILYF